MIDAAHAGDVSGHRISSLSFASARLSLSRDSLSSHRRDHNYSQIDNHWQHRYPTVTYGGRHAHQTRRNLVRARGKESFERQEKESKKSGGPSNRRRVKKKIPDPFGEEPPSPRKTLFFS